jgi:type I restriction enzyme R subunit
MTFGGERSAVQTPLINYAKEVGWEYVSPEEALRLRGGKSGFIFKDLFTRQFSRLNDFMDPVLADEIIRRISLIPPTIEGNFTVWEYLKGLKTVFVPEERRERNVKFIDTEDVDRNVFQVTDEFSFTNGSKTIRLDVVFLINGIPILFVETKAAHKIEGMADALDQVRRYHRECPELLVMLQIYAITHIISYYYGATWNVSERGLYNWKDEQAGNFETLVKTFFDRKRIAKMLTDFILFTRQDDELRKVILRPHQMRAVDKIMERALSDKKRGLIWHTQGSGKTYTMVVAAKKLIENPAFENPTIIMLVDRNELESQLFGNLDALGIKTVERAESKEHLKELLENNTRGLIVTMIHKFDGMPENINTRKNIFVLVDEAHRTTGGKLGNYLMGALPNATYLGFTGTPIDKTQYGKGTFKIFGMDDPPKGYLDKYSIAESIEDGTTVPLHYSLAPNELLVARDILEREFLDLPETQGISDVETLNRVLDKAVNLKNMLKNRERMEKVAKYAMEHYKNYIEPMGYKAFLVGVDREACALYKEELDKLLPEEYSKVVYSRGPNDDEKLARYHLSDEEEKRIRKDFRDPEKMPKILIVTEKLLTGFDAPILYCMYLDKPMRDHVLLQAIARVNRPYGDDAGRKKTSGLVIDFVGIFSNLEKALAFDSVDIEGVVKDINELKKKFAEMMEGAKGYLLIIKGKTKDKSVEAVLEYFRDEEKRREFYRFFKALSNIYEILSPDPFLRPYLEDYEILARIYKEVLGAYDPSISVSRELTRKTAELVQKHTKSSEILPALEIYEINEDLLRKLEESKKSDTEKVFNLIKSIEKEVRDRSGLSPYLISIGERAEAIAEMYKERQKNTQEALDELKKLIEEINRARREETEKKMSSPAFTVYWLLNSHGLEDAEEIAKEMDRMFEKWPYWQTSEKHEREIRRGITKLLVRAEKDPAKVTEEVNNIMRVLKGGSE